MSQEEAAPRIVVRDRRKFSADGSRRDGANPAPGTEGRREERREEPTGQPTPASDGAAGKPAEMPASPPAEKPPGEAPSPKAAEAPSPKADPRFRQLVSLLFSQAAVLLEAESRTAAEGKPAPPDRPRDARRSPDRHRPLRSHRGEDPRPPGAGRRLAALAGALPTAHGVHGTRRNPGPVKIERFRELGPEPSPGPAAGRRGRAAVAAVGNFDGVHLGHRRTLRLARREAEARAAELVAVTFDPHPARLLRPRPGAEGHHQRLAEGGTARGPRRRAAGGAGVRPRAGERDPRRLRRAAVRRQARGGGGGPGRELPLRPRAPRRPRRPARARRPARLRGHRGAGGRTPRGGRLLDAHPARARRRGPRPRRRPPRPSLRSRRRGGPGPGEGP